MSRLRATVTSILAVGGAFVASGATALVNTHVLESAAGGPTRTNPVQLAEPVLAEGPPLATPSSGATPAAVTDATLPVTSASSGVEPRDQPGDATSGALAGVATGSAETGTDDPTTAPTAPTAPPTTPTTPATTGPPTVIAPTAPTTTVERPTAPPTTTPAATRPGRPRPPHATTTSTTALPDD